MLRSPNSALLLAGMFLLSTVAVPPAKAQKASSEASASQTAGAKSEKPKSKDGAPEQGKAASDGCSPAKQGVVAPVAGTSGAGDASKAGDPAKADGAAKTKTTDKADGAQPCADAPQPQQKSAADQFAFPEAISRKAAQATAGSGLPDNAAPNAPMPNDPANPGGDASGDPLQGAGIGAAGAPAAGGNPFPPPTGKAASTPERGGLLRRDTDPNDPYAGTPVDPPSSSSPDASGSGSSSSGAPDSNVPSNAQQTPRLELKDAGSSGQMIDSYRAEKDDDVADFYNKRGNYEGAYLRYQDAVHFNPDDEAAQYGLAEMALKLGHTQEAIDHYRAYLKMAPSGSKAKDAEKAIKRLTGSAENK
ncbi:MAG: hypothetical protein ACYCSN_02650 [Acidobacteriaceae bacterium]